MTTALAIIFLWWLYPCTVIISFFKGEKAAEAFYNKIGDGVENTLDFIFNDVLAKISG